MSPCIRCGESAKRHGGACVGLQYDEEGNATYHCLSCYIESVKELMNL